MENNEQPTASNEVEKTEVAPAQPPYCPTEKEEKEVHEWFTYHAPKGDQAKRYELLRDAARELAFKIMCNVPNCADRSAAIRKLRECIMTANAAIACGE